MKIKSLIIALCICNLEAKSQIYFEVNGGINKGNFLSKENDKIKPDIGYIFSANVNVPLTTNLLMQTGLQYESIHSSINTVTITNINDVVIRSTFNAKSHVNYINVPVKLLYTIPSGKDNFSFGAGPYVGIGVSGRNKSSHIVETTANGSTTGTEFNYNEKVKFGSADTDIKRISLGVGANISYVLTRNISFGLYSNIGLTDQNNSNEVSTKSITYGVTVGYVFGKRKKDN